MSKKSTTTGTKRVLRQARFRIMPLTLTMLSLIFVIKLNDLYLNSRQLSELLDVRSANAQDPAPKEKPAEKEAAEAAAPEEADAKKEATDALNPPEEAKKEEPAKDAGNEHKAADAKGKDKKAVEEERTHGAGKMTLADLEKMKREQARPIYTKNELDVLQNLSQRREELDQRERDLGMKSSVLEATEKRLNTRVDEMKQLQKELGATVAAYQKQQNSEIMSLVKIYENMKPLDAAKIFDEMEMPILLEVIDKMSERKVAPVLAGMDPRRARDVTQELAEMRKGRAEMSAAAAQAAVKTP